MTEYLPTDKALTRMSSAMHFVCPDCSSKRRPSAGGRRRSARNPRSWHLLLRVIFAFSCTRLAARSIDRSIDRSTKRERWRERGGGGGGSRRADGRRKPGANRSRGFGWGREAGQDTSLPTEGDRKVKLSQNIFLRFLAAGHGMRIQPFDCLPSIL